MGTTNEEGLIPDTTTCRLCGSEIRFMRLPQFNSAPTICDECDAGLKEEERQKGIAELERQRMGRIKRLPFTDWDNARGNMRLLMTLRGLAFPPPTVPATHTAIATSPRSAYIVGKTGMGKTRAACEIAKKMIQRGMAVRFVSCMVLADEYRVALADSAAVALTMKIKAASYKGLLILDDFGVGKETERSAELWYAISDERCTKHMPTWWTSNLSIDQIDARLGDYGPRTARRIADECLLVRVEDDGVHTV